MLCCGNPLCHYIGGPLGQGVQVNSLSPGSFAIHSKFIDETKIVTCIYSKIAVPYLGYVWIASVTRLFSFHKVKELEI